MTYISHIQRHAEQRPDALALSQKIDDQWQHLTWKEVWQQVSNLAACMHAAGCRKGDKVAIFADNRIEWSLVDLACAYAGLVSVPIYATSSPDQVVYIVNHADCRLLFADAGYLQTLSHVLADMPGLSQVISFDPSALAPDLNRWLAQDCAAIEPADCDAEDLFTLVYTSGTTGQPKGVMLTHGSLLGSIEAHLKSLNFTAQDRSLAALPLSHVLERGWTAIVMYVGGHNHYLSDMSQLPAQLLEVRPHVICTVPRMYEKIHSGIFQKANAAGVLAGALVKWAAGCTRRSEDTQDLSSWQRLQLPLARLLVGGKVRRAMGGKVRFSPCGGAALDADIHDFFMGMGINVKIGYGLTETLGTVSMMPDQGYRSGTMGRPMAGIDIRIEPVTNEILVRGPCMSIGYYRDEKATAELLDKDGWLHTGDAGHIDDAGNLVFQERIKELMKTSGGKYIAPQHVEGVLMREPMFEQVALIADARNFASALIVPAWNLLEDYAKSERIRYSDRSELARHPDIIRLLEERLIRIQQALPRYEQVKRFTLLLEPFSVSGGEITPTLKLKRRIIAERFREQIEAMYVTR